MINRDIFTERFKALRTAKNLTMVDVADALNIKKQSVNTWETKKTVPSSDKLVDLAILLNVSIDYLVGRTDVPEVNKK